MKKYRVIVSKLDDKVIEYIGWNWSEVKDEPGTKFLRVYSTNCYGLKTDFKEVEIVDGNYIAACKKAVEV